MHYLTPSRSLALASLLLIGCTGDDLATDSGESATTTATASATDTTTTGGATDSASASDSDTTTTTGGESDGQTTTAASETESESDSDPTTSGADTATTTTGGVCGDGVVDPGEDCDDGPLNGSPESECTEECTLIPGDPVCGNGIVEPGEDCDAGDLNGVPGSGCTEDCTPEPGGGGACPQPEEYISCDSDLNKQDPMAPYHAIGVACSDNPGETVLISDTSFNSINPNAWQVAKGFGTYIDPDTNELLYSAREGESFLMMSTGVIAAPNAQGRVTEPSGSQSNNGSNGNASDNSFLPGYSPGDDQSGVLLPQWQLGDSDPNDKIWFSFKTKTPPGTEGYSFDFAFFSSEWPEYVATPFNDLFVAWEVSENFIGTVSRIDDLPTTITALHPHWSSDPPDQFFKSCFIFNSDGPGFSCDEPQLQGTGFEGHAGTTWVRVNQPLGENMDLEIFFFLADMSDDILATGVLLDGFRLNCEKCIPENDPLCTGEIPDPNCCGVVLPQ